MSLDLLWFIVVAAIFTIYFFLEGFDFGVDLLRPFMARNEAQRKAMIGTIGPFWDGNEVWMILAAGAIFAAFPAWYGALLTSMYPLFALILLALIGRGVAFEFRAQVDDPRWRVFWDITSFIGSVIPAFFWGVIMANMVRGLPLNEAGDYVGRPFAFFDLFSILGGLATLALFVLHGATFLLLRLHNSSVLHARARRAALTWGAVATVLVLGFVYLGFVREELFRNFGFSSWLFPVAAALNLGLVWLALTLKRDGLSFAATSLTILFSTVTIFASLFPNVLPSTLGEQFNLTIANSASQPYNLYVLTWVGVIFLPLVIGYQVWNYYVFRQRVKEDAGGFEHGY